MQELSGGRAGAIYKNDNHVHRPLQPWSHSVHQLLKHLPQQGFDQAPKFIGIQENQEVLSFIEGDTYNYPLVGAIASQSALETCAQLQRKFHAASESFLALHQDEALTWMLPAQSPAEIICHGDFTPYNVALTGNQVTGVFDFDTAHPGSKLWDLAFSVYCWAPFKTDQPGLLGEFSTQRQRALIFCDHYQADVEQRENLVSTMIQRINALIDYMQQQADTGNEQFQQDIEQGHLDSYFNDVDYLHSHQSNITQHLLKNHR